VIKVFLALSFSWVIILEESGGGEFLVPTQMGKVRGIGGREAGRSEKGQV
jgi:hypothetical protein